MSNDRLLLLFAGYLAIRELIYVCNVLYRYYELDQLTGENNNASK